jgi:hypothetical protein
VPRHYKPIGEAYVHGMVKREIVERRAGGEFHHSSLNALLTVLLPSLITSP